VWNIPSHVRIQELKFVGHFGEEKVFECFVEMFKSRIMRWAGHVARMGTREVYTGF
jgi:hypothetical protein